ncbi:hypothetical protein [Streptomyces sp. NRRL S-1022]|uniref:hypothetical protein n=1 Tax=Streptomyces sp. NRRL S-1022 TaxID=1463880 RepID=UPI0004BFC2D1|nr:hypothetical protein [Streptomyces sp. NRRL S-1022]
MTTQVTFRPGAAGLMAALSVAEKLTSISPVTPRGIQITANGFDYVPGTYDRPIGVELYFHESIENVQSFAQTAEISVANRPHPGPYNLFTFADGVLDGVPFRAWTLTTEGTVAAAA